MVQNVNPTFVKTPNTQVTSISTGNTNATAVIYTGGANGSKISSVILTASTTSTQDVRIAIVSSASVLSYINTVSVSTAAGFTSGQSPINGLAGAPLAIDSDGNPFLFLNSSAQTLNVLLTQSSSIWTSGAFIAAVVTGGDF